VSEQLALFERARPEPEGLRYAADFVSPTIEQELILGIRALPLQPFQFGEFEGKRRVASFGFRYDYDLRQLQRAEPIPAWLAEIVANVETFGGPATRSEGSLYRIRRGGLASAGTATSRISTRYSAYRWDPPASLQTRLQDMGLLHDRCRSPVAVHDDRRVATDMGTQHSRRRGAEVLNYISHYEERT
jgi:hypothetical protein